MKGHLTLLSDKGQTPGEAVHEVGQPVGMGSAVELANVHDVVLIFEDSGFAESHHTLESVLLAPED